MTEPQRMQQRDGRAELAAEVAGLAPKRGCTVAVAESLTGGMVASALAESRGASEWFRGGVVAYSTEVKHQLLDVPPGPVVSRAAAAAMARSVRRLLGADLAVSVTGSGGPEPQDGQPPGTVYLAVDDGVRVQVVARRFMGKDPPGVCADAVAEALRLLAEYLRV